MENTSTMNTVERMNIRNKLSVGGVDNWEITAAHSRAAAEPVEAIDRYCPRKTQTLRVFRLNSVVSTENDLKDQIHLLRVGQ